MRRKLCKFVSRPVIDPWEPELLILYLPITGQLSNLDTKIRLLSFTSSLI